MNIVKSINEILKQRRLELNMTMLDVAKLVGVSEGTVSRWESGDIANMRRDKITALAKTLQISPAVIMGWTDDFSIDNSNNCGVIGEVNSSAITIKNGYERTLTTQEQDLLRIYNTVDGKTQMKIMNFIYDIEEQLQKGQ